VSNKNYVPLNEFILLQRGFDLPQSDRISGDIPVVASTGVAGFHNEYKVDAPGVVIGRSGSIGEVNILKRNFGLLIRLCGLKTSKDMMPDMSIIC
jgi:type I restriction enzyme S subunit